MGERDKLPPTPKQLERLDELIQHEAITPHLNSLLRTWDVKLKTRGGAGGMLRWMRAEIEKWEAAKTR